MVSIKKIDFEIYLKQYKQAPSIRNCHLATRSAIDCTQWKINYECRNDTLFTSEDISHDLYLFCFQMIQSSNYKSPQHLLNKICFKINRARANLFYKNCISTHEHKGMIDNSAYVLQQSAPSCYDEPLCQKAFELMVNDDTRVLEQYAKGFHPKQIAKQLALEESKVKKIVSEARHLLQDLSNWKPKTRNLADLSSEIKPLFDKGVGMRNIAAKLGVSYKKVRGTVIQNGWWRPNPRLNKKVST